MYFSKLANSVVFSVLRVKFSWLGLCPKGEILFELMQFNCLAYKRSEENHFYHYENFLQLFPLCLKKKKKNQAELKFSIEMALSKKKCF